MTKIVVDPKTSQTRGTKRPFRYLDFSPCCFGSVWLGDHEYQGGESGISVRIDQRGYFCVSFLIKDTERSRKFYFSPHPIFSD